MNKLKALFEYIVWYYAWKIDCRFMKRFEKRFDSVESMNKDYWCVKYNTQKTSSL